MANKKEKQRQSNVHDQSRRIRIERNQITDLIINNQLITTHRKAKSLQKIADHLITLAKENSLHSRREALKIIRNIKANDKQTVLQKLFQELAPKYKKRSGGYTRVLKYGIRKGDSAPISIITFV